MPISDVTPPRLPAFSLRLPHCRGHLRRALPLGSGARPERGSAQRSSRWGAELDSFVGTRAPCVFIAAVVPLASPCSARLCCPASSYPFARQGRAQSGPGCHFCERAPTFCSAWRHDARVPRAPRGTIPLLCSACHDPIVVSRELIMGETEGKHAGTRTGVHAERGSCEALGLVPLWPGTRHLIPPILLSPPSRVSRQAACGVGPTFTCVRNDARSRPRRPGGPGSCCR